MNNFYYAIVHQKIGSDKVLNVYRVRGDQLHFGTLKEAEQKRLEIENSIITSKYYETDDVEFVIKRIVFEDV